MSAANRAVSCRSVARSAQSGAATLVIVAVLFLVLSLVAAYTNRNLIFEQRTSGNHYRATQAFEAAEAGLEWALAQLNGGRIGSTCAAATDAEMALSPQPSSFRERYLIVDPDDGTVEPADNQDVIGDRAWPSCVFDGTDWVCSCPEDAPSTLAQPVGAGVFPAFRIRFVERVPARPGTVGIEVKGCTRLDPACLEFDGAGVAGEGHARLEALIALRSALPSPPVAAVTVRRDADLGGSAFAARNPTPGGSGIAIVAGGTISNDANLALGGPPGSPPDPGLLRIETDSALLLAPLDVPAARLRMFGGAFAAVPGHYRNQPAALRLDCAALTCDANLLRRIVARHPGRLLWLDGDVALDGGVDLGSPDEPVLLIVEGALTIDNLTVHGFIHGRPPNADLAWALSGDGATLRGALLVENDLAVAAGSNWIVEHDVQVLTRLRWQHGSFVRVPGGWRDF